MLTGLEFRCCIFRRFMQTMCSVLDKQHFVFLLFFDCQMSYLSSAYCTAWPPWVYQQYDLVSMSCYCAKYWLIIPFLVERDYIFSNLILCKTSVNM